MKKLHDGYTRTLPQALRFQTALSVQLQQIVVQNSLALAMPIETRVKTWESIVDKLERRALDIDCIDQLTDMIGFRLVFLFTRDLQTVTDAISGIFHVVGQEDTGIRLGDDQFGYQSLHYIVRIPSEWTKVPVFSGCESLQAELQLRTIAQHTWAAASHLLQYKRESSIPRQVRRSINRVSALLETVDLEFERVLSERESYLSSVDAAPVKSEVLNVDIVMAILTAKLPVANRTADEEYADLVANLKSAGIETNQQLDELIDTHIEAALKHDAEIVAGVHPEYGCEPERIKKGVYLTHTGLVRHMLDF